jgi:ABC-type oligopeptide transport system ATPase subunit
MLDRLEVVLKVEGLTKAFAAEQSLLGRLAARPIRVVNAVTDVTFSIPRGETFALIGESGAGKSTIARCIAGVLAPSAGRIMIMGHDLASAPTGNDAMRIRRTIYR